MLNVANITILVYILTQTNKNQKKKKNKPTKTEQDLRAATEHVLVQLNESNRKRPSFSKTRLSPGELTCTA